MPSKRQVLRLLANPTPETLWEHRDVLIAALRADVRRAERTQADRQFTRSTVGWDPRFGPALIFTRPFRPGWRGMPPRSLFTLCLALVERDGVDTYQGLADRLNSHGILVNGVNRFTVANLAKLLERTEVAKLLATG